MLLKCCTQYASKFGKFISVHRTGKGQFSFQSQRKEMPKNVQTTAQLHSSHMPGGSEVKVSASNAGDWVQSLGREDPLEKEMVTHSSILAWRTPWTEKPSRGDGIPVELFQILKDDGVKVLHTICQKIWKTAVATGLERSVLFPIPKKGIEKGMATRSSILSWKIPCTEEPGRLQPMGSQSQTSLSD